MRRTQDKRHENDVRNQLEAVLHTHGYSALLLLDAQGRSMLSLGEALSQPPETLAMMPTALAGGKVQRGQILRDLKGALHLDFVVPLRLNEGGAMRNVAVAILHVDPQQFLLPSMQAWPTTSPSAESLLLWRRGDTAVYLNEPRFGAREGFGLRAAADGLAQSAATAAHSSGYTQGRDYRHVEVLAAWRTVRDTDWRVIAKQDQDEIFAPLRRQTLWIGLALSTLTLVVAAMLRALWMQQRRALRLQHLTKTGAVVAASEARFRALFEQAAVGVAQIHMPSERFIRVNRRFAEIFGYTPIELMSLSMQVLIHPAHWADERMHMERLMRHELREFTLETRYIHRQGHSVWLQSTVSLLSGDGMGGDAGGYMVVAQDISQRKEQEDTIRRLLSENQSIFHNVLVGIVHVRQRHIVSCNRRIEEIFGYEAGETIGQSIEIFFESPMAYVTIARCAHDALVSRGSFSEEVTFRKKDGVLFWGALTGCAIDAIQPREDSVWVLADISERKRAQDALRVSHDAYQSILATTPDGFILADREGYVLDANASYLHSSGYAREELLGLRIVDLEVAESADEVARRMRRIIDVGGDRFETIHQRKDGSPWHVEVSVSYSDTNEGQFFSFLRDITARRESERQLKDYRVHLEELVHRRTVDLEQALAAAKQADRAKDMFLANVSHELRTPLNAVLGLSALAQNMSRDPKQKDYLGKVNDAGNTLARLIDDLLDLSKMVAGRMQFERVPVRLRDMVRRCHSLLAYKASEKGIEFRTRVDAEIPAVTMGDPLRIEQIMLNLASNAIKFTPTGWIELRIVCLNATPTSVEWRIEVEDTGIGLSELDMSALFKPFSQVDAGITRKYGGTGLGLAICKQLTDLMGGEIDVQRREGSGCLFRVRLRLDVAAADVASTESVSEEMPLSYSDAHILVVDDQPLNHEVIHALLAEVGIDAHSVDNGAAAIELLSSPRAAAFDLVLMDLQMPVMDGLSATRELRRRGFAHLPIVAMTAHTMADEIETCLAAGMNDHIAKPVNAELFYRVLARWLPAAKHRAYVAKASATPLAVAVAPPALSGVDRRAGLASFAGDEARYRYWLGKSVAELPDSFVRLRQAVDAGQHSQARQILHAMKGRSGTLGMTELHATISALNVRWKQDSPGDEGLNELGDAIEQLCGELRAALAE